MKLLQSGRYLELANSSCSNAVQQKYSVILKFSVATTKKYKEKEVKF